MFIGLLIIIMFMLYLTPNAYSNAEHYRFDKKQIVYETYPSIVHMHSDPLKDISVVFQ